MLTRRGFVKLAGGAAVLAVVPAGCGDNVVSVTRGAFFDAHAWATIDAASEIVFPGASAALAVRYIDTLLSAFDVTPPRIFAGGPFSGRTPYPDAHGAPSSMVPENAFLTSLPLSRVQEIAWRMRIYGSAATAGGDFNDALLGPTVGYRELYTRGIAALDAAAGPRQFADLAPEDRSAALFSVGSADPAFFNQLLAHVIEGMFAAPEYGGNADLSGWKLARYDGDSAPLGHAFYDATTDAYVDRADQPTSSATPGDTTETFDDATISLLTLAAAGSGGARFF